ncbi:hypothetical protein [Arthrobacter sp. MDT1-65]
MRSRRRIALAAIAVALGATSLPVAAHAVFTGYTGAPVEVSTAVIAAPDAQSTVVTSSCQGSTHIRIGVEAIAAVQRATGYELRVIDPAGNTIYAEAVAATGGEVRFKVPPRGGPWTYEFRGTFLAPGAANAWVGEPLRGPITCR